MKKTALTLTIAASVLALSACGNSGDEKVLTSKVGDVTKDQLYSELKSTAGEQALQLMMIEKVLEDKYKVSEKEVKAKFDEQKAQITAGGQDFKTALASQGMNEDTFKRYTKLNLLQEKAQTDGVKISDEEIKKNYDRQKTSLKASHILVADEAAAKKIEKQLKEDPKKFAAIAKKESTDQASASKGGELGWFGPNEMVEEFTNAAYDMKKGEISKPIKSSFGYHIIKLEDTKKVDVKKSFEDSKESIKNDLLVKKAKTDDPNGAKVQEKVAKLMKDAKIEIKDKDLKSALDSFLKKTESK
ncbi:foldase protein PrsA [Kurthia zopfii]|uniref:Foldase protein PrsA n=1 Tax=Kurthia zopfii TaxID=1650 RepID=A0A8B4QD10_9BACL|nr:peptidylprolyl isomerase [Kurthia zopfii]PWI23812.1 foldase [Kurthia zopfii]TDR43388.1 foldase protein PrsA [Kurthia zopfii]GEK31586.1 foldase protein PrsA [Kurthia zopfii]STX10641.1 Foldase protein prsA 1 precursor [Kurthia zopfii]